MVQAEAREKILAYEVEIVSLIELTLFFIVTMSSKYSAVSCKLENYGRIRTRLGKEDIEQQPKIDSILEQLRIIFSLTSDFKEDQFVQNVLNIDAESAQLLEWSIKNYSYRVLIKCDGKRKYGVWKIPEDHLWSSCLCKSEDELYTLLEQCQEAVVKSAQNHKCSRKQSCDICENREKLENVFGPLRKKYEDAVVGSLEHTLASSEKCQNSESSGQQDKGIAIDSLCVFNRLLKLLVS